MPQYLKDLIKTQVTSSMKDGDKFRTTVLRMILAEIQKIEIEEKSDLDELQITSILEKMIKQRNDSISQFKQGRREDLAKKEQQEVDILSKYKPEQLSEEEITEKVKNVIIDTGAESMRDIGKVMGLLKSALAGKADMGLVSKIVKDQLS